MMGQRLRLADEQGKVLVDTFDPEPASLLDAEQMERAIPLRMGRMSLVICYQKGEWIQSRRSDRSAHRLSRAGLIAALVAVGISLVLALFLSYRLLLPVHALTQAAGRLAQGDLSQRVQVKGNDELAQLGDAFNHMAASLQKSEENRRL